jgi:hypothetical protein
MFFLVKLDRLIIGLILRSKLVFLISVQPHAAFIEGNISPRGDEVSLRTGNLVIPDSLEKPRMEPLSSYSFVVTYILAQILDKTMGIRISETDEVAGLDLAIHAETAYENSSFSDGSRFLSSQKSAN